MPEVLARGALRVEKWVALWGPPAPKVQHVRLAQVVGGQPSRLTERRSSCGATGLAVTTTGCPVGKYMILGDNTLIPRPVGLLQRRAIQMEEWIILRFP